jgi:hypothetical protein
MRSVNDNVGQAEDVAVFFFFFELEDVAVGGRWSG